MYQVESEYGDVAGVAIEKSSHSGIVTKDSLLEHRGGVEHSVAVV